MSLVKVEVEYMPAIIQGGEVYAKFRWPVRGASVLEKNRTITVTSV